MAIQMRRGNYADYDESKIRPGEWAVATDTERVFIGMASGAVEMAKKSDVDNVSDTILDAKVKALESIYGGEPSTVDTVAEMTNTDLTYIYSGSESGYTAGHWYYWDGTAWTDGGQYAAGMILDEITDYILESYVTDHELVSTGLTFRRISDTQVAVFGTVTANRRFNIFNGQSKVMTTTSAFDPILPAGTYKITVSAENLTSDQVRISLTYGTYSNTFANVYVGTSKILECTDPIMFGVNVPNGTVFGTEDNPTIITAKVERYTAKDEVARASAEKANSDVEKFIIYNTASGAVASFSDGADDYPIKGLTVAVEAIQSGSGDPSPSNIRNISGFDSVKIVRTGKNLLDSSFCVERTQGGITTVVNDDGSITISGTASNSVRYWAASGFINLKLPAGTYHLSGGLRITYVNPGGETTYVSGTFTLTEETTLLRPYFYLTNGATYNQTFYPQLEVGSVATDYEKYNPTEYTISLGDTIYGGALDVIQGKLVVDRKTETFDGSADENWNTQSASRTVMRTFLQNQFKTITTTMAFPGISNEAVSIAQSASFSQITYAAIAGMPAKTLWFLLKDVTDTLSVADFREWLNEHPLQVCYELATPVEITLSPTQINTLLGVNNIYSDAGDVSVEYPADTKQFILNAIASALA